MTDGRANPALSDERIDDAPPAIRALFREYDTMDVINALTMAGINDAPSNFSEDRLQEGVADARKFLEANERLVQQAKMNGATE
ncbi:hypothetical protein CcrColossus_gp197 [Caulobacter phage CcrColossus]|uniref:Uncharacterized protein n=1 Tax=Caulobacter phage CcrColossus TaxID=1211640 RepID=K4K6B2_9CAUD|nr:hypothetical protein CcrColossus_gp197 [Caulobacter phage CcrColossus]AFU88067.1 hypothetical protein CcrColossus_gp197 [Caulobacter phage CcrColossus]